MPAAGMRRTTRVFGVVQGGDGARVLRSGRRLWPDDDIKPRKKTSSGDEWLKLLDEAPQALTDPGAHQSLWQAQPVSNGIDTVSQVADDNLDLPVSRESDANYGAGKMFGIFYSRKRKRFQGSENVQQLDRLYGAYYVRRKKKRLVSSFACLENDDFQPGMLAVTFKGFRRNLHWFATFISSILTCMRNKSLGLKELFSLLSSQPIATVFARGGITISLDPSCTDGSRCCKFYCNTGSMLLFSVNFSSLPLCFMHIHSTMLLEAERSSLNLLVYPKSTCENTGLVKDRRCGRYIESSGVEMLVNQPMSAYQIPPNSLVYNSVHREVMHLKNLPKLTTRTVRKKRTSRMLKKAQNSSLFSLKRSNRGRSISDFFTVSNRTQPPFIFAPQFHRRPASKPLDANKKVSKSLKPGLREDAALTSCSSNVLVIEADKCYREEGACITLEQYPSNEWFLVVKRNGEIKCCHKAEKCMRPSTSNYVTRSIIWTVADCLKLEFFNEGDWKAFKELYKECAEKNMQTSSAKFIPVPGVTKVSSYDDERCDLFLRPEAYISQIGDEVSHALTRRNPNYDMDSEDEEWLNKFNTGSHETNSMVEHISDRIFELIIDSLEKFSYFMPVDLDNGKVPAHLCLDLCSREVLEAVHVYWINKRKKKQSALVRVFQAYQGLNDPVEQDNFQRKRRQSKRAAGHSTKGKQQRTASSAKCIASRNSAEELDVMAKVETADALARQRIDLALKKRSVAQKLMVNADLMMYKAKMSIQIADEAQLTGSSMLADPTDLLNQGPASTQASS